MLVISKLMIRDELGDVINRRSASISLYQLAGMEVWLTIKDTETYKEQHLESWPDMTLFMKKLRDLNPYGFMDVNKQHGRVNIILVVSDVESMRFLSFVDSVKRVDVLADDKRFKHISNLESSFEALDDDCSLFKAVGIPCTLYHAMCRSPKGWLGDRFYLFCRHNSAHRVPALMAYEVKFCNVRLAKRFIAKAMTLGFDPVQDEFYRLMST